MTNNLSDELSVEDIQNERRYIRHLIIDETRREVKRTMREYEAERDAYNRNKKLLN